MTVKLYCFGESGNAYKAALTLTLAGIDWTPVYVDFFNGGARSPEFLALNPMGEVPVMVAGDLVLSQSGVMQAWVTETTGRFGGRDAAEAREVLRWMFWDNHKMSGQAGSLRFMMNFLPEEKRPHEAIRWLSGRVTASLQTLERVLQDRDWLVGDGPTTADFACCGYLFYPEPFGFDRRALPAIDAWLGRIEALPGWRHPYDTMPGSPADRA
ncbi:glutathione S-transferase family protein [Rhodovulum visakhapatnamense]|uniref:Glutathione S-transferase n=1 Tax=Rhodovulum visakhapatnamense TaxID=364297 RepID=A0A4R8FWQ4_9RHOB|nr:glutathione S-transferase [Rhodovulum visakhapatnamense]TDX27051.1 glutathione S-transferase [Rhodovulum visakhapatnamense]